MCSKKWKADESILCEEMEGSRDDVVPLLNSFVQGVNTHLEMLEEQEGDNDDEIETWEMHAQLVLIKWQQCLKHWHSQEVASDDASEAVAVTFSDREGDLVGRGGSVLDAASVELYVCQAKAHPLCCGGCALWH